MKPLCLTGSLPRALKLRGLFKRQESLEGVVRGELGPPNIRPTSWNPNTGQFIRSGELAQEHKNKAATAQTALSDVICHLASEAIKSAGSKNLILAGGVALNCSANGETCEEESLAHFLSLPHRTTLEARWVLLLLL